ncbi:unnamed protein product, partial [Meganyctiphanes norvegica]
MAVLRTCLRTSVISVILLWIRVSVATSLDPKLTYDYLYREGIKSYLDNDWDLCARNIEWALEDWHWWKKNTAKCRAECHIEADNEELLIPEEELTVEQQAMEQYIRNTLCLMKCKREVFGTRRDNIVDADVEKEFKQHRPYDYLQLCYFKLNRIEDAANAAATVLAVQPQHEVMQMNLKHYLNEGGVDFDDVYNLELQEYGKLYIQGSNAYYDEDWLLAIEYMEKSLELYWEAEAECRLLCENPFDQGWFPDYISSVANHYTVILRCKSKCEKKLANLYGSPIENFLASYFNFLQYAYFQDENILKACEAVESFLTLDPDDAAMIRNKQYYFTMEDVAEPLFVPRNRVFEYAKTRKYENQLINYIETSFVFLNDDATSDNDDSEELDDEMGVELIMADKELGGRNRMVTDGFLTKMKCQVLMELTKLAAVDGDGYNKYVSPHTNAEEFKGVTLGRAGFMVHAGLLSQEVLDLVLEITNDCLDYIERHFNLKEQLHFSFTHLVCRSAKPGMSNNRSKTDLSHDVHVDNCILQDKGDCLRIPPAYTFRDY